MNRHAVSHAVTSRVRHAVTHAPVTPVVTVPPTRPDPTRKYFTHLERPNPSLQTREIRLGLGR